MPSNTDAKRQTLPAGRGHEAPASAFLVLTALSAAYGTLLGELLHDVPCFSIIAHEPVPTPAEIGAALEQLVRSGDVAARDDGYWRVAKVEAQATMF